MQLKLGRRGLLGLGGAGCLGLRRLFVFRFHACAFGACFTQQLTMGHALAQRCKTAPEMLGDSGSGVKAGRFQDRYRKGHERFTQGWHFDRVVLRDDPLAPWIGQSPAATAAKPLLRGKVRRGGGFACPSPIAAAIFSPKAAI